ncbi:MAG: gliding motility-associated C-terminal domain-containing protein [Alphaproteobacteria bacterium]|nr:gliding motility-associated C-terminal domain-containing protein [Alphaproteobacteria bacterium]
MKKQTHLKFVFLCVVLCYFSFMNAVGQSIHGSDKRFVFSANSNDNVLKKLNKFIIATQDTLILTASGLKAVLFKRFPDSLVYDTFLFKKPLNLVDTQYGFVIPSSFKTDLYQVKGISYQNVLSRPKLVRIYAFNPGKINALGWGLNFFNENMVENYFDSPVYLAGGEQFVVGLNVRGQLKFLGRDLSGEGPIPMGIDSIVDVRCGWFHSIALKYDGTVICWGNDFNKQVSVPHTILDSAVSIVAGGYYSGCVKESGRIEIWGAVDTPNTPLVLKTDFGQRDIPKTLGFIVQLAPRGEHVMALSSEGKITSWGQNDEGQTNVPINLPIVTTINGGWKHSLAIKYPYNTVAAWGESTFEATAVPANLDNIIKIDGGDFHSMALKNDGTIYQWGGNYSPLPQIYQSLYPVPKIKNVVDIAAGDYSSYALYKILITTTTNINNAINIKSYLEVKKHDTTRLTYSFTNGYVFDSLIVNDTLMVKDSLNGYSFYNILTDQKLAFYFSYKTPVIDTVSANFNVKICANSLDTIPKIFLRVKPTNNPMDTSKYINIQWFKNTVLDTQQAILVANLQFKIKGIDTIISYIPPDTNFGTFYYFAKVKNAYLFEVNSKIYGPITLIKYKPTYKIKTIQFHDTLYCKNDVSQGLSLASFDINLKNPVFRWFYGTTPQFSSANIIPNYLLSIFYPSTNSVNSLPDTTYYFAILQDSTESCTFDTLLNPVKIIIDFPEITKQPDTLKQGACKGAYFNALSVEVSKNWQNKVNYYWYKNNSNFSNLLVDSTQYYQPKQDFPDTSQYYCIIQVIATCNGAKDTSNFSGFHITNPIPSVTLPLDTSFCSDSFAHQIFPILYSMYGQVYRYQWQRITHDGRGVLLDSLFSTSYALSLPKKLDSILFFRLLVTNQYDCKDTSGIIKIRYTQLPHLFIDTLSVINPLTPLNYLEIQLRGSYIYRIFPSQLAYPNETFSNQSVKLILERDTVFKIIGIDANGCSIEDSLRVDIDTVFKIDIYPSKVITPNDDGENDFWKIINIEYYPLNEVVIYNTYNEPVRTFFNYHKFSQWRGESQYNTPLPNGQYIYIIKCFYQNRIVNYKSGFIAIRR